MPYTDISQDDWQEIILNLTIHTDRIGRVGIIVRKITEDRLKKTCFRNRRPLAGNFFFWENAVEVVEHRQVMRALLKSTEEALAEGCIENSVCVDALYPIGWSGTDTLSKYQPSDFKPFQLSRRSLAFRIKLDRLDLLAPPTNFTTLVFEIKTEPRQITVIIHSMYPGLDVGPLRGNVSERERCVFFDWDHPGKRIL